MKTLFNQHQIVALIVDNSTEHPTVTNLESIKFTFLHQNITSLS